jgi:hypothetical protein
MGSSVLAASSLRIRVNVVENVLKVCKDGGHSDSVEGERASQGVSLPENAKLIIVNNNNLGHAVA